MLLEEQCYNGRKLLVCKEKQLEMHNTKPSMQSYQIHFIKKSNAKLHNALQNHSNIITEKYY